MAVTVYTSPSIATTVKHTPSWATLWSICNDEVNGARTSKCTLAPSCRNATKVPWASMIPVNMGQKYAALGRGFSETVCRSV